MLEKNIWNTAGILDYIANNRESKLHSVPFEIKNKKLQSILDDNQFIGVRQRLTQLITRLGKGAIFAIPFNGDWVVQEAEVLQVRFFMRRYIEYIRLVNRQYYYATDGGCHDLYTTFNTINSIMHITQWYETPNSKGESIKTTVSAWQMDWPTQSVPVWIFSHNADLVPDIVKAGATHLVEQYADIIGDLSDEWKFVRTGGIVNQNFTGMTADEYEQKKRDGHRYTNDDSFNSKLQEGIGTTMTGSSSIADVINLTNYIKDQIFHLVGVQRDEPPGTKQVGSLEIMSRQDNALDTLYRIKEFQQKQWNNFFNDFCVILGIRKENPEIQLSLVEELKIDMAKASVEQLKGSVAQPSNNDTSGKEDNKDSEDEKDGGE